LKSNGTQPELIQSLLRDARLWGLLNKLLEDQIVTLKTLRGRYESWAVLHEQGKDKIIKEIQTFGGETDILAKQVHEKFKYLTATSQDLIQLVKRSTPTSRLRANTAIGI